MDVWFVVIFIFIGIALLLFRTQKCVWYEVIGLAAMTCDHRIHTLNDHLLRYSWTEQFDVVHGKLQDGSWIPSSHQHGTTLRYGVLDSPYQDVECAGILVVVLQLYDHGAVRAICIVLGARGLGHALDHLTVLRETSISIL